MGPVRHKQQLIQVVACLAAINMAVGVVAVYARNDSATTVTAAAPITQSGAAPRVTSPSGDTGGGILAGAQFRSRRRTAPAEAATAVDPGATLTSAPGTSATSATSSTAGSTGRPRATSTGGSSGRAAPATSGRPTTIAARPAQPGPDGPANPTTTAPGDATDVAPIEDEPVDPVPSGGGSTAPTATTATTATTRPKAPSGPKTPKITIGDRTGDTVIEGTTTPAPMPRADLIETQANYSAKAILLTAKTADTVQPKDDPRWLSESTFVSWELDTNRDGAIDYEVQFFFADGTLIAGVSRPGDTDSQSACAAEAGQTADGYTVGIDPACVGNPGSFSYRATTYYDTDPAADNGNDVVTDVAPDGTLSQPVSRP